MACGRGSSDRRSLADWVELPVGDPRANGLAHGLTGQHSLDLPAPSGGLFALRRDNSLRTDASYPELSEGDVNIVIQHAADSVFACSSR